MKEKMNKQFCCLIKISEKESYVEIEKSNIIKYEKRNNKGIYYIFNQNSPFEIITVLKDEITLLSVQE